MTEVDPRSSVRIELDGSGDAAASAPAPEASGTQPIALMLLLVGLAVGFLGLVAVSGGDDAEDAAEDVPPERPLIGDIELSDEERVWIGDVPLFTVVVEGIDGWYGVSGGRLYSADGPIGWERVVFGAGRALDVSSSGDGVNLLVADDPVADGANRSTEIRVVRSTDGEFWKTFDEATVPDVVHAGSLNGTNWSVLAGPAAELAGEDATALQQVADRLWVAGDEGPQRLRLADNDWVRGQAATLGGAIVISQTVDFFSTPTGIELPTRLLRLTPDNAIDVTPPDADLDADSRVVRSGDGTVWLVDGLRAWAATAPYEEWRLYADASGLDGVSRLDPVLNGGGVIASLDRGIDAGGFRFTTGDGQWQEFSFPGVSELGVLLVDDGELTVSAVVDGTRQVTLARSIEPVARPEFVTTKVEDGEWALPVLAADVGNRGFVGLTNVNGTIGWFDSNDGLTWATPEVTDLPFGFFADQLRRTSDGWVVVGRLGLLEDAAFESTDGLTWNRVEFVLPRGATAVELDTVSRSPFATAVLGSLGWADDLSRTERFLLWWRNDGEPIDVPLRPCPETQGVCTIRSIATITNGVLVTHVADQRYTVSRWTEAAGWEQVAIDQPLPDEMVHLERDASGITYFGAQRILRSETGDFWYEVFDAVDDIGPYLGVSVDGSLAVAARGDTMVVRSPFGVVEYGAPGVRFGAVLAVDRDAAIVRAITPDGPGLARLAGSRAEPIQLDLPSTIFERLGVDPDRPDVLLSVGDGRLYESPLEGSAADWGSEWNPVPPGEVGAARILDLSIGPDGLTLLSATASLGDDDEDQTTAISVSRRAGEVWEWLGTTTVPLEVSGGSLNGTDWVVRAGPTLPTEDLGTADQLVNDLSSWLYIGSAGSAAPIRVPTGASELAVDVESTGGGAMFLSVDLDFFNESPPSLQLKRWEPDVGVTVVQPGGRSVTEDDHLWLNADGRMFLARDGELWSAVAPYEVFDRVE
jgi:hypothetical protein